MVITFGVICQFYTVIFLDNIHRLVCLPTIFIVPQACVKFNGFVRNYPTFFENYQMLRRFYRQCETVASVNADGQIIYHPEMSILVRWIHRFKSLIGMFVVMVVVCCMICVAYPMYAYIADGRIEFALYIYLPFVAFDTASGVLANWASQLVLLTATGVGLMGADLTMVLLIMHSCTMSDVLCGKVRWLANVLQGRRLENRERNATPVRVFLCDCIRLHQAFCAYLDCLAGLFYTTFTAEVSTNFVSMCVTLLALMQLSFFPLYSYMVLFMVKTFLVCVLGTIVDIYVGDDDTAS